MTKKKRLQLHKQFLFFYKNKMPIEEGNTTPIEETKTIPIEGKNTNTGKETKTPNTNAVEKLTPEESVKRVEQLINEASGLDINYLSHDPD